MKRRSLNKKKNVGDVKKQRSEARLGGRGAGMAGPGGEPSAKRRTRSRGSEAREDRLKPHGEPKNQPGSQKGGPRREGDARQFGKNVGVATENISQSSAGRLTDDTPGARRPEEHGGSRYMNRGAGNKSNRGDTHGGKKPYNPAAQVDVADPSEAPESGQSAQREEDARNRS